MQAKQKGPTNYFRLKAFVHLHGSTIFLGGLAPIEQQAIAFQHKF